MQPDLANILEIAAALGAIVCWFIRPSYWIALLALILIITVGIEFTSKYLKIIESRTGDTSYRYAKYTMYSLFNIVKFCGTIWFLYLLLADHQHKKVYLISSVITFVFVISNLLWGQGYKIYNNYSAITGILILTLLTLWKLRQFEGDFLPKWNRYGILIFLFSILFFYVINLPFFVFFQQMINKDQSDAIRTYKEINGNANCIFYVGLVAGTMLCTVSDRKGV